MWDALITAIDRPELGPDPRFATTRDRHQNGDALHEEIAAWTRQRTKFEAMEYLASRGVPCSAVYDSEDILNDRPYEKTIDACITAALDNRPEIRSFALRHEQAKSHVKVAQGDYYPSVSLVGNYAKFGDTPSLSGSIYKDQESWYVMALNSSGAE
jgi:crotonobetainyl-CoA:carnitine CoA-transferase CaiB-like acyl-CoA transferase